MELEVALAVLGAALLHAAWNALVKSSEDKELDTVAVFVGSALIALLIAPFLPLPSRESLPWIGASALVHIFYFVFLTGAYRHGDLSYTYPLMRGGAPLLVALSGALWFGEVLGWGPAAGVLLIGAGVLGFAYGAHDRRALWFALGNAAVIATYTLIDARGARLSGAPVGYTMWFFVAMGVVIGAFAVARRGRAVPAYAARHWRRALAGGACSVGAYAIALWAMTRAPVALVAALRETAVVFAAVLGTLFLGERFTRRRLAATGAVLAGLLLLRL